jgi:hypothetical protein
MLIAELHGKVIAEAQNNEDCLTSWVFGHLRYLPPKSTQRSAARACDLRPFWEYN